MKYISMGLYEKPRDAKVSANKPEILRILALLYVQNKDVEKAKATYAKARAIAPNDEELKKGEFEVYYNSGYAGLAEEEQLVKDINASRADKKKYDELMGKRKAMFMKVLPDFEKAYSINPTDTNTKNILKLAYEITGQLEKAKAITQFTRSGVTYTEECFVDFVNDITWVKLSSSKKQAINVVLSLHRKEHATFKTRPIDSAKFMEGQHAVPLTVEEFVMASRHFPIIFSSGDNPVPLALMGLNFKVLLKTKAH